MSLSSDEEGPIDSSKLSAVKKVFAKMQQATLVTPEEIKRLKVEEILAKFEAYKATTSNLIKDALGDLSGESDSHKQMKIELRLLKATNDYLVSQKKLQMDMTRKAIETSASVLQPSSTILGPL